MRREPDQHLQHALYGAFVAGPHDLTRSARIAGVSADMLGKICRGERHLLAELPPRLYLATGDLGLYATLTGAGDVGVAMHARPLPGVLPVVDLRSAMLGATAALGRLAGDAESALADGHLDLGERIKLEQDLDELGRQLETIRDRVKQAPTPLVRKSGR